MIIWLMPSKDPSNAALLKAINENKESIDSNKDDIVDIRMELLEIHKILDRMLERTALIPKLYKNVDMLISEIREGRHERAILFNKLENHLALPH